MTAYFYRLQSPKHNVQIRVNGELVEAAVAKYLFKPNRSWGGEAMNKKMYGLAQALTKCWDKPGVIVPKYIIIGGMDGLVKPGATIIENPNWKTSFHDDPDYEGMPWIGEIDEDLGIKFLHQKVYTTKLREIQNSSNG